MYDPPIFSEASNLRAIRAYDRVGRGSLMALGLISGGMSGLGFVYQFDAPTLETYLAGAVFALAVFLIARIFWNGAWFLPEFVRGNLIFPFVVVASLGFGAFATVSYFGNQRFVAAAVSENLAQSGQIDALANAGRDAVAHVRSLDVVLAGIEARGRQAGQAALTEQSGTGPSGQDGTGPVYRSFIAAQLQYRMAATLVSGKLAALEPLAAKLPPLLDEMRHVQADSALTPAERRVLLKSRASQAGAVIADILALDPAGAVRQAAGLVAAGVPDQSGARADSQARIAEIRAEMRIYATSLMASAATIDAARPEPPVSHSLSQEEHLMANILRLPGLSMAALLFDACGWIVIGFRLVAYQALRHRYDAEDADMFDQHLTRRELVRIETMARHLATTQKNLAEIRDSRSVTHIRLRDKDRFDA